ncbi:hypothetical protein CRG98_025153 [Punica granatum]|uniref:Fe2OG dioxygenase domain-containing protein n=1 Tax=Punica granatum TaxID=22663 RepID=A0A2I0JEW0_PUNGR|nr:hypothetical protein CRG98_025153 [Punica granatum]
MKDLALGIMELLAISLGVERLHYREFFEDSCSIMRCNYYPPCKEPSHVLGTGPHRDPNSLTILHEDQVGGLEVFTNGKWHKVRPHPDALALSNGRYRSCLHRAVVNEYKERMSLAFFFSPAVDKVVRPVQDLLHGDSVFPARKYPDFTWSVFLRFIRESYRADGDTLLHFSRWLLSQSPVMPSLQDPEMGRDPS